MKLTSARPDSNVYHANDSAIDDRNRGYVCERPWSTFHISTDRPVPRNDVSPRQYSESGKSFPRRWPSSYRLDAQFWCCAVLEFAPTRSDSGSGLTWRSPSESSQAPGRMRGMRHRTVPLHKGRRTGSGFGHPIVPPMRVGVVRPVAPEDCSTYALSQTGPLRRMSLLTPNVATI
jgi:hypothetical protein